MNWLIDLFTTGGGVAHTVILYALVISFGVKSGFLSSHDFLEHKNLLDDDTGSIA